MKQHSIPIFSCATDLYASLGIKGKMSNPCNDFCFCNLAELCTPEASITTSIHRTGFYSIIFVKNAGGHYLLNQQTNELCPGSICFANPGDVISFSFREVKELYLLTLNESFLRDYMHTWIMREYPFLQAEAVSPLILPYKDFVEFELLYWQIKRLQYSDSVFGKKQIGYLLSLILLRVKETLKVLTGKEPQTDIVGNFKQILQKHYLDLYNGLVNRPYNAAEYAEVLGIHPNYLNNVIRKNTGKPVSRWIIDKTISESKSLLEHCNMSIKEVAYRLGFVEAAYFCRYFKRYAGMTAAEYRRKCNEPAIISTQSVPV